ncbi:MAG: nicotinate phosphoribosyltransferase [Candidatus Thorarchaeota archaeon]|nr:nicotinate phosphoribosyltransferase [Candidatus Thorarchaeota archaeon]
MRTWRIASEEEILSGKTTDTYFENTLKVLQEEGIDPIVHAEVTVSGMPEDTTWAVVAGVNDALKLLENKRVSVYGLSEGTLFFPHGKNGVKIPVLSIEGPYSEFAVLETPMLGFICHTSGMATRAAYIRKAAGDRTLLSFGARRTHPAITPQVEYAAYIGGCDGISCVLGAELLNISPSGTMPHALVIAFGNQTKAWKAFDRHIPKGVPRIAIADTYFDEVVESLNAAENVEGLLGVRLDTPSSRRGNFRRITEEVRWELDIRGFGSTKIYVSGGLDRKKIKELQNAPVDGYGVGGAISNSPSIDFAMDIVALNENGKWKPIAKRGKFSGRKIVWRCPICGNTGAIEHGSAAPKCSCCEKKTMIVTVSLIEDGRLVYKPERPADTREKILAQLAIMEEE